MAGSSNGQEEENYWPGFVDALTTMTMILTFILMVLGIVVFSLSQSVSKAYLTDIADAAKIKTTTKGMSSVQIKNAIVARLRKLDQLESGQRVEERQVAATGLEATSADDISARAESTGRPRPDGESVPASASRDGPAQVTLAEPDPVPFAKPTRGGLESRDSLPSGELPSVALQELATPETASRRAELAQDSAGLARPQDGQMPGIATLEVPSRHIGPDAAPEPLAAGRLAEPLERPRPETATAFQSSGTGLSGVPDAPSLPVEGPDLSRSASGGPLASSEHHPPVAADAAQRSPQANRDETASRVPSDRNELPEADQQNGASAKSMARPEGDRRPTNGGPRAEAGRTDVAAARGGSRADESDKPETLSLAPADGVSLPEVDQPDRGSSRLATAAVAPDADRRPTAGGPLPAPSAVTEAARGGGAEETKHAETLANAPSTGEGLPVSARTDHESARIARADSVGDAQSRPTAGGPLEEPSDAVAAAAPGEGPVRLPPPEGATGRAVPTTGGPSAEPRKPAGHPANVSEQRPGEIEVGAEASASGRSIDKVDQREGPALVMLKPEPDASAEPRSGGTSDGGPQKAGVPLSTKATPQATETLEIRSTLDAVLRSPGVGAELTSSAAQIVIRFRPKAINLGEQERAALRLYLTDDRRMSHVTLRVEALTFTGSDSFSDERRLSFFRMMTIRNEMLSAGLPADRIKVQIIDSPAAGDRNIVRIYEGS